MGKIPERLDLFPAKKLRVAVLPPLKEKLAETLSRLFPEGEVPSRSKSGSDPELFDKQGNPS